MDRHRVDADPDPNFHVDADPYPDPNFHFDADPDQDGYQNDADPHAVSTSSVTHYTCRKSEFFCSFVTACLVFNVYLPPQCQRCHNFQ